MGKDFSTEPMHDWVRRRGTGVASMTSDDRRLCALHRERGHRVLTCGCWLAHRCILSNHGGWRVTPTRPTGSNVSRFVCSVYPCTLGRWKV
jgi:hypothetical protein